MPETGYNLDFTLPFILDGIQYAVHNPSDHIHLQQTIFVSPVRIGLLVQLRLQSTDP